jgi:hypothetical protein
MFFATLQIIRLRHLMLNGVGGVRFKSPESMASGKSSTIMKWVGYTTAILSLIAGLLQIGKMVSGRLEAGRKIDALLLSEEVELKGQDYWSAWRSLEQASQIDPDSAKVHAAQEALAMEWLENIRVREDEKFSDIAEKLEPVLTRAATSEKSASRQADLLAHVGWSYFLRSREGRGGLDPAGPYAEAAQKDANNPYAQAMWGHWILWNRGDLTDAERHFTLALASHRQRDYVRQLQLSALMNVHNDQDDEEVVRVANAMRMGQEPVNQDMRSRIFSLYYARLLPPNASTAAFINAVAPPDHLATFQWLFEKDNFDESGTNLRSYYLCALQEAAGRREDALAGYKLLKGKIAGRSGSLLDAADAGIKRLSRAP